MNAQNLRDIIISGYSIPLTETTSISELLRREAQGQLGPLVKDIAPETDRGNGFIKFKHETGNVGRMSAPLNVSNGKPFSIKRDAEMGYFVIERYDGYVRVIDPEFGFEVEVSTNDTLDDLVAAVIKERNPSASHSAAIQLARSLAAVKKEDLVLSYAGISQGIRKNRRHKPGRSFERIGFDVGIKLPVGEVRDIRRHRMHTILDPVAFSSSLGSFIPPVLIGAGLGDVLSSLYESTSRFYQQALAEINPWAATMVLPLAAMQYMNNFINLRELHHICELRTQPGAHLNYKKVSQMIYLGIKELLPVAGKTMIFVDKSTEVDYGRALQELRAIRKGAAA